MSAWVMLRRRPGVPAAIPADWLGSADLEYAPDLATAEMVAAQGEGIVVVQAERVRDVWLRLPVPAEYRGIKGEPTEVPGSTYLAAWAVGIQDRDREQLSHAEVLRAAQTAQAAQEQQAAVDADDIPF